MRLLLGLLTSMMIATGLAEAADPENSVVRVLSTVRYPNPLKPWSKQEAAEFMGTGVVLEGKRILTNAHLLTFATDVVIQSRDGEKYDARIDSIGPDIDLATLSLEDESFFDRHPPLPKSTKLPASSSTVSVLGYPIGGNNLAVTRGVVSRIDFALYGPRALGLRMQIDAAINPGSSGGPVLVDGQRVGLTFGQLGAAENVGYVIPNEEIEIYLEDVRDGRYDGKLNFYGTLQSLSNEALRSRLGVDRSIKGIVYRPDQRTEFKSVPPLEDWDVITKVAGISIDNQGEIEYEPGLRLAFASIFSKASKHDSIAISVLRGGKPVEIEMPLSRPAEELIRGYGGKNPPYFVYGPVVFSPVLAEAIPIYMRGGDQLSASALLRRVGDRPAFPGEELVVVTSPFLDHKIAKDYDQPFGQIVHSVDGIEIKNLKHLVETLRDGRDEFVTIRFASPVSETLVFRRKSVEEAMPDILSENGIPKRGTDDLLAVWSAASASAK